MPEEDIREGIRRIGKVLREQVGLFGTLTGAEPARAETAVQRSDGGMAEVVELPRREQRDAERHTN